MMVYNYIVVDVGSWYIFFLSVILFCYFVLANYDCAGTYKETCNGHLLAIEFNWHKLMKC